MHELTATTPLTAQLLSSATGTLLLTSVLLLWRRSVSGATALLSLQGLALSGLGALVAAQGEPFLYAVAALLLAVKAVFIPTVLLRTARRLEVPVEADPVVNPTVGMLLAAALTTVAYLVTRPLTGADGFRWSTAVAVGIAMVLIGFLVLATRRQALAQIIGFVMVDNGIGATAFLTSGGLPVVIELGVLFDVVLVVLILLVLTGRIRGTFETTELHELTELRD